MSDLKMREITRKRAARLHQDDGHWHVERRSTVIISRAIEPCLTFINSSFDSIRLSEIQVKF